MYLTLQYVPGGGTMVAGVERLPAGHLLVEENGRHRIERYWDLVPGTEAHARSRAGVVHELRERLEDAVQAQMHADVPVGALLSGGVDSAGIVALMRHVSGAAPRTFTVGFEHAPFDEREPARNLARALGADHTELVVGPPTLAELERFAWHLDEPVADQAALPTYLIAQVASEHVKVVLTGEGSDELFGGYPRYGWFRRAERLALLPQPLRAAAAAVASRSGRGREAALLLGSQDALERHVAWTHIFGRQDAERLLEPEVAGNGFDETSTLFSGLLEGWRDRPTVEQMMYLDFKTWLPDDILTKADRMTMAASIEARAPYLDQRVIEFAGSLPVGERLRGRGTKALLRAALADLLPDSALRRRKASFRVPVELWLGERLRQTFGELLLDPGAATAPYLRRAETERLVEADGRAPGSRQLWSLVVLELWLKGVYSTRPVVADRVAT
jgi:asparagine synthase (glutamine-hydrolysing)